MIVVADSSPLIGLCRIGRFELLRTVFGRVIVPEAVWREIVLDGRGRPGTEELQRASWFEVVPVRTNLPAVAVLELGLDRGEAEAIAVAQELNADVLLMDEKLGRATAKQLGLTVTGIVGVLIAAKRRSLAPDAVAVARELQQNGIWLAEELISEIERA